MLFISIGALLAGVSVILGAVSSHLLGISLSFSQMTTLKIAIQYQFWHAIALMVLGLLKEQKPHFPKWPMFLMLFGSITFSGSLYLYLFSGVKILTKITPIGGFSLLFSWILVSVYSFQAFCKK